MRKISIIASLVLGIFTFNIAQAQVTREPWTAAELKSAEDLAKQINNPSAAQPVIINVGPQAVIKGSLDAGAAHEHGNIDQLKSILAKQDKNREVVLYCGCCPFEKCPNIRPAFAALKDQNFTKPRLLDIPKNIKTNWIDKGYPVN
ncbi:rhodanese-like domain-containing protein [Dyadobacter sp.]|uniref:rhodanese-like domain-containing protein n=1 Tax=Dyadobacter sp. TaxID=1914288 RepID=UPI003F722A71